MVHALHSNGANSIWEHSLLDPTNSKSVRKKPQAKDPVKPTKADFIRTKHQLLGFVFRGGNKEDKDSGDSQDGDVSKQLHSSVRTANLETSLRLLSCGADPNYLHQEKGTCPLHVAAGAGQASQVELLLIYGADPGGSDSFGKTPSDHSSEAGYKDIAHRLVESQFELTDRISYYLCERKPDHSSGQHFLIPEMADSIDSNSEVAKAAKRKLQMLPNYLFEEMAMDAYDEVDRRETEQYWLSLQGPVLLQTVDRSHSVPFLPVNAELSPTRNQARQKLGRLNAHDEPLYDSVASEEEFVLAEQQQILAEQKLANSIKGLQDLNQQKSGVSVEAYIGIKEQLSLSNVRMQELLASNTNMQTQIAQLQNMVQTLVQENNQLKTQPVPVVAGAAQPVALNGPATSSSKSLEEPVTLRGSKIHAARHYSMYEPREGPRSPQRSTPTNSPAAAAASATSATSLPVPTTSDEVVRRTNIITKRIQEVFHNVQNRRHDQVEPCAQRIVEAVQSMATIVPQLDPRGRTPLMLAVTLENLDCAILLLENGANVNVENKEGWTVVQEAVSTGNHQIISAVLQKRDLQRHTTRMLGVPALLQKLKEAPDFYMEMKWEFTSWVPLVSRMCPSDTYKVYKQGSNVRIDTTLLGFDQSSWQRGSKSYLFKSEGVDKAVLLEMDHEAKEVFVEELRTLQEDTVTRHLMTPSNAAVMARVTSPIVHTYVDTEKISFERNKSGLWGWRSDKTEVVNGRDCKVFSASNVELVTKTRTEHLSPEDKSKVAGSGFLLNSLLAVGQHLEESTSLPDGTNPDKVTMEEYFDSSVDLGKRDIGRPKEMTTKVQKFKEADRLSCVVDDSCFVTPGDYTLYGVGGASVNSPSRRQFSMDEEDELLQYAIQQSLLDVGSEGDEVDIWEALKAQKPPSTPQMSRVNRSPLPPRPQSSLGFCVSPEEEELQRAIEASLGFPVEFGLNPVDASSSGGITAEAQEEANLLAEALVLSARETALEEERRSREDNELLQRILELSLLEK
nr:EOG090X0784 [Daphnia pulex]